MPTFALDTATASPSLALVRDDRPIAELWLGAEPGSGRRVLEAAHGLLSAAGTSVREIDGIVVGVGPGGFTGLRIGIATALGLGQALRVPVNGASTLEALALGLAEVAPAGAVLVPVLDARRRELFAAAYRSRSGDGLEELLEPSALPPAELARILSGLGEEAWLGGEGVEAGGDELEGPGLRRVPEGAVAHRVRAAALARRVAAGAGLPARPVYARLPDAEVNRLASAGAAADGQG
ncbi:MAG TPA: tRNA (adenosine(37)-N6)-threonylcarbamoyltransferase complex dimerization subunit type 1 TsaB [Miltoncostaeaceae bacterium]|nr:tRNA (adenosine(37)-N6)-threonylcarbamoyltransferase complex dimerization subunit type 1 TsaB [Miltoncostaeaceae bacterium]